MIWQTTRFDIDLSRPQVMGIVNVTPDSFSDGGCHATTQSALAHCEQLIHEGADMLDIGGESTRPGAPPVCLSDELARVVPLVKEAVKLGVPVSVDTYKPQVMQAVLDLGADIINDVWALRWRDADGRTDAARLVAAHARCGVCLMHMHLEPQTMQVRPMQGDVVPQVRSFLTRSAQALTELGVENSRIVLTRALALAKRWRRTLLCWRANASCWRLAIRCWRAGHASHRWRAWRCTPIRVRSLLPSSGWPPAWPRRCVRCSAGHPSFGCTTSKKRCRRCACLTL